MNLNFAAKNLIPELTDSLILMKKILDETEYSRFHHKYNEWRYEMEKIDHVQGYNDSARLEAQAKREYALINKKIATLKEPTPKYNLKEIISNHINEKEIQKIIALLKEKQKTEVIIISRRANTEESNKYIISDFLSNYKYLLDIAYEKFNLPELKLTKTVTLIEKTNTTDENGTNIEIKKYNSNNFKFSIVEFSYTQNFPAEIPVYSIDISGSAAEISQNHQVKIWNEHIKDINSKNISSPSGITAGIIVYTSIIVLLIALAKHIF